MNESEKKSEAGPDREQFQEWGRQGGEKGGRATGRKKRRGTPAYYKRLGKKSGQARRKRARIRKKLGL